MASRLQRARVGAEAHRPAIGLEIALIRHKVDHRLGRRFVDLAGHCLVQATDVASELDARELHTVADSKKRHAVLTRMPDGREFPMNAASSKTRCDENSIGTSQGSEAVPLDGLGVDAIDLDVRVVENACVIERLDD